MKYTIQVNDYMTPVNVELTSTEAAGVIRTLKAIIESDPDALVNMEDEDGTEYVNNYHPWVDRNELIIKQIIEKAETYEQGKMMREDSEVEINIGEGEVWLADYSESRGGSELVEQLCDEDMINPVRLREEVNKRHWYMVYA